MLFGLRVFYDNSNAIVSFIYSRNTATALCLNVGSIEPDVQETRMGRSQPGVGLWSPHFFVLHFFESGLTLNPHNKRHSFGLFISLYLCCVVDCINEIF